MESSRRRITFRLPNLTAMTDEDLQKHFFDRDGPWSDVTKAALVRFKVDQLDLDSNWASTPRWWSCPGCGREKSQIFRVSSNGVLLARLDRHHDHLQDRLKAMLKAQFGPRWVEAVGPATGRVQALACSMIARFEPSLVCIDCNNVDGRVKKEYPKVASSFSFSPGEIRQLIVARANQEHDIDFAKAIALYDAIAPNLAARESLLTQILGMIASGDLNQQRGNIPYGNSDHLMRHLFRGLTDDGPYREVSEDFATFERRSLSRGAAAAAKSRKRRIETTGPTAEELAAYDGGGEAEGLWNAVEADWTCPACARDRAGILRRSKNRLRKWSGKLVRHTEFVVIESVDEETGVYDERVDHEVTHLICMDCAQIAAEVKKSNAHLSKSNLFFQLRDMQAVATAKPNQPHEIDWALAAQRLENSEYLSDLVRWYHEDRTDAFYCRALYDEALAQCRNNRDSAKRLIIDRYMRALQIGAVQAEEHIRERLARATHLTKADAGQNYKTIRNRRPGEKAA